MQDQCPVCSSPIEAGELICKTCGFRLQGKTEEFAPLSVDENREAKTDEEKEEKQSAVLLVLRGLQKGSKYELNDGKITLGRDPKCTIFLNDMTVSRHHATIVFDSGSHIIKDEGSFNGVWINNKNYNEKALLNGDVIQLGAFCFEYQK